MSSFERGVYRQDCFNGIVEYSIYDSNKCLIVRAEMVCGVAGKECEELMQVWLDQIDPGGVTLPDASLMLPPSSSGLAA